MAEAVAERVEELRRQAELEGRDYDGGELLVVLRRGVEPRLAKTRWGFTLVHYACQHGWLDFVKFLIQEHNCNPHAKTQHGLTPLHYACLYGRFDIVGYLTSEQHCDPDCCDNDRQTPLHWLSGRNRECTPEEAVKIVRFLISLGKCDINKRIKSGSTALLLACRHEVTVVARCLTTEGHCDVTIPDNCGDTALHICRYNKTDEISKLLLEEAKIDPNAKNNDGDTPLHLACRGLWNPTLVQLLVRDERCNPHEKNSEGDTALHVACRLSEDAWYITKLLLKETNIDPNAKNNDRRTPLDLTSDADVIRELIRHGANPRDVYKTHGKVLGKRSSKQPLETQVKLFMVGNPSAGKSTLTKALQSEVTGFKRLVTRSKPVSGVDKKTAGIVPHEFESKIYGRVTLYDFAGQREFYGSHAALLQNALQTSTPIFLLVVDLSKCNEDLKRNIFYWLSFLENQCTSVSSNPHLVAIGSHADVLKSRGEDPTHKASFIISLLTTPQFPSLKFTGFVIMDCQYADSAGMAELHRILKTSCDSLRMQENINFNAHCFLVYLLDKCREATALTLAAIQTRIKEDLDETETLAKDIKAFVPSRIDLLENICDQLNDRGHLLVLKNPNAVECSWVIINRTALLAEVNGTIFAPEGFKEHIKLASSTGVVPLSSIAKHFPRHDLTMLVGFLSHLEFCHEISDVEVLGLISLEQASTASEAESVQGERYFFFPGLVTLEVPSTVWEPQPQFDYHCGWILQCSQPELFFGPRLLQVLLLRLAFSCAFRKAPSTDVPSLQRKCSIWKNGIYWGDRNGVETLVEVAEQSRVVVLMRCPETSSECLQLRSLLIQKVLAAAREFCSKASIVESFIARSDSTQYPLKPTSELTRYDITEVATAVAKCKRSVVDDTGTPISLDSLLSFEPYADLGEPILRQLFAENNQKRLKIFSIAERIPDKKTEMMKKIFKPSPTQLRERMSGASIASPVYHMLDIWRASCEGTYQCLREKLDQFSVFAGRNPLEVAGVSCETHPQPPSCNGSAAASHTDTH